MRSIDGTTPTPKFAVGDSVTSPYVALEANPGSIASVESWQPPFRHGVTGEPVDGEHWYYVSFADGSRELLSDTRMRPYDPEPMGRCQ